MLMCKTLSEHIIMPWICSSLQINALLLTMEAVTQQESALAQETMYPVEDAFQASWKYQENQENPFVEVSSLFFVFFCITQLLVRDSLKGSITGTRVTAAVSPLCTSLVANKHSVTAWDNFVATRAFLTQVFSDVSCREIKSEDSIFQYTKTAGY